MKKKLMVVISMRAANLAVRGMDDEDLRFYAELGEDPFKRCYEEYLDQLQSGDSQCLRTWLGWKIEEGSREAIKIMKLLVRLSLDVETSQSTC